MNWAEFIAERKSWNHHKPFHYLLSATHCSQFRRKWLIYFNFAKRTIKAFVRIKFRLGWCMRQIKSPHYLFLWYLK
jgi:hypothetical protein